MDAKVIDYTFPIRGVDVSTAVTEQPPLTSPNATNVRSRDAIKRRYRGGSRNGLIRYPDSRLPETESVVTQVTATGPGVWVAPMNVINTAIVEVWGGGGSPFDAETSQNLGVGGGGGGEYARLSAFAPTAGTKYSYVIGSGGPGPGDDGEASTFSTNLLIAHGGLADGTGGTGGTGDVVYDGGQGGNSGVGLGGGGGGSSGYFFGIGNDGTDGQAALVGGIGGAGLPLSDPNPQGAGGDGATAATGSEVEAEAGEQPGGGGGGGSADSGGVNPLYLASKLGASGAFKISFTTASVIQHLGQIVLLDDNYLISSFEDYNVTDGVITDPSTNPPDPDDERNPPPGRPVPPGGSGPQPNRRQPPAIRRRVSLAPSVATQSNGANVTLTINLTDLPGGTGIGSGVLSISTIPRGLDGDGLSATTNGGGTATLIVNEPSYEGTVTYLATHVYVDALGRRRAVRGIGKVTWVPDYTMSAECLDGYIFTSGPSPQTIDTGSGLVTYYATISENAVGTVYDVNLPYASRRPVKLKFTLRRTSDGKPIANRRVRLGCTAYSFDILENSPFVPVPPYTFFLGGGTNPYIYARTNSVGEAEFNFFGPLGGPISVTYVFVGSMTVRRAGTSVALSKTVTLQSIYNDYGAVVPFGPIVQRYTYRTPPPTPGVS